ncbi:MAG: hypothetical protein RR012_05865 [Oscillospiraceae bacterium]
MIQTIMDICHFEKFGYGPMALLFGAFAGGGWTIAYIDMIRIGIKQKTYGMPMVALALNIVWEAMYATLYWLQDGKWPGGYMMALVNTIWVLFDFGILYTHFKYGKKDFIKYAPQKYFVPWTIMSIIMAICIQYGFYAVFDIAGNGYTAILQNIPMSMLYIFLLFSRKSTEGQTMLIAIGKMVGTLGATIAIMVYMWDILNILGGLLCFMFDMVYIVLLYKQFKAEGKNPWKPCSPPVREPDLSKAPTTLSVVV